MSRIYTISLTFYLLLAATACGGSGPKSTAPQATLAQSFRAQEAIRRIEGLWATATPSERLAMKTRIRRELALYQGDPRAVILRQDLVWIALEQGDTKEAERLLAADRNPPGTSADFARVLQAGVRLRRGDAAGALAQLQKLQGILIVPDHRVTCDQLLIEAALASGKIPVATRFMLDILLTAPVVQQEAVRQRISAWFTSASASDLEDAYTSLTQAEAADSVPERDHARAVTFLIGLARRNLLASALREQDAALAKRIIEHYVPEGDTEELARLAATGDLRASVVGRSLGVILELGSALSSQRSAQVAMGLSAGLGLLTADGSEPEVTLRTRSATDDPKSISLAFDQLVSEGAAIVVAGVTPASSDTILQVAERTAVPTLLLTPPAKAPATRRWTFLMGESAARIGAVLSGWSKQHDLFPQDSIAQDDARCAPDATSIGDYLFPVGEWHKQRLASVLFFGSEDCGRKLLAELKRVALTPTLLLGADAAALFREAPHAVTFSVGQFPPPVPSGGESVLGDAQSWYYSLAHDAAVLGKLATEELDSVMTNQPNDVAQLHSAVAQELRAARSAELWTTAARGFNDKMILDRELSAIPNARSNPH